MCMFINFLQSVDSQSEVIQQNKKESAYCESVIGPCSKKKQSRRNVMTSRNITHL